MPRGRGRPKEAKSINECLHELAEENDRHKEAVERLLGKIDELIGFKFED